MSGSSRWASKPAEMISHVGWKRPHHRLDHHVERVEVGIARGARRHREVHRRAQAGAVADLLHPTRAGVERRLVQADVEDSGVVEERGLRAVAVVGVVVDDRDPLALLGECRGGDGDVGEQAEAHRLARRGVMAWRANGAEGGRRPGLAALQRLDRRQAGTGGERRGRPRSGADARVGVDATSTSGDERLEPLHVAARVHTLDLLERRRTRLERHQRVDHVGVTRTLEHRRQPFRPLRVAHAGEVVEVRLVRREEHRHCSDATVGRQ